MREIRLARSPVRSSNIIRLSSRGSFVNLEDGGGIGAAGGMATVGMGGGEGAEMMAAGTGTTFADAEEGSGPACSGVEAIFAGAEESCGWVCWSVVVGAGRIRLDALGRVTSMQRRVLAVGTSWAKEHNQLRPETKVCCADVEARRCEKQTRLNERTQVATRYSLACPTAWTQGLAGWKCRQGVYPRQ
jgi:hypothetical protein